MPLRKFGHVCSGFRPIQPLDMGLWLTGVIKWENASHSTSVKPWTGLSGERWLRKRCFRTTQMPLSGFQPKNNGGASGLSGVTPPKIDTVLGHGFLRSYQIKCFLHIPWPERKIHFKLDLRDYQISLSSWIFWGNFRPCSKS